MRKPNLTKRCDVKAWFPPEVMVNIAGERTRCLVDAYYLTRSGGINEQMRNLETLVRSSYMQGVNDAGAAILSNRGAK